MKRHLVLVVSFFLFLIFTQVVPAKELSPEVKLFLKNGDFEKAYESGFQLEQGEQYASAIEVYQSILVTFPTNRERVQIQERLAFCYEKLGQYKNAIAEYHIMEQEDPATYEEQPYYSYRNYATLRIVYLSSPHTYARKDRDDLFRELKEVFQKQDLNRINALMKKGDYQVGHIYSEPVLVSSEDAFQYLKKQLTPANLPVSGPEEIWEGQFALVLPRWKDPNSPDYDLLYLPVIEGLFGWEWSGIILSKTEWKENR